MLDLINSYQMLLFNLYPMIFKINFYAPVSSSHTIPRFQDWQMIHLILYCSILTKHEKTIMTTSEHQTTDIKSIAT